jgi:hypothetical protein
MLLARHWPGRWCPLLILLGFACWLVAMGGFGANWPWLVNVLLALLGLGALCIGPLCALNTTWLCIDGPRGWVHWRQRTLGQSLQESFSTQRLTILRLKPIGLPAFGLGGWSLTLELDHPRLREQRLGLWWRPGKAEAITRRVASALALYWLDGHDLLHVACSPAVPAAVSCSPFAAALPLAPPPEIDVRATPHGPLVLLPNFAGLLHGYGLLLLYALIWNIWAWSCLLYEGLHFGPAPGWSAEQTWTLALLLGASLAGLPMLHGALLRVLGRQALRWQGRHWQVSRRWLRVCWGWQSIHIDRSTWLRRVDPPGVEAGLWVPDRHREIQLGHELSAEGLAWLQQTLRGDLASAQQFHPSSACNNEVVTPAAS